MVRSASLLIAISAPVLPALTAAPASPLFTAWMARPMLVVLARRSAGGRLFVAADDILAVEDFGRLAHVGVVLRARA